MVLVDPCAEVPGRGATLYISDATDSAARTPSSRFGLDLLLDAVDATTSGALSSSSSTSSSSSSSSSWPSLAYGSRPQGMEPARRISSIASGDPARSLTVALSRATVRGLAPAPAPVPAPTLEPATRTLVTTLEGPTKERRLTTAVMRSEWEEAARLLAEGADPNTLEHARTRPLHIAATIGSEEGIRMLLGAGALVDARNDSGDTALHVAVSKMRLEASRCLLDAGANVHCERGNKATALHVAAATGSAALVDLCLDRGADPNARNTAQDTPLIVAAASNHYEATQRLLEFRPRPEGDARIPADVNAARENGATALHFACTRGNEAMVRLLLEHGADPDAQNNSKDTPLIVAADAGHLSVCERLIQRGAKASMGRQNGATALHVAAGRGMLDIVRLCLDAGRVPVDVMNNDRETPLLVALARGRLDVARALLEYGASMKVTSNYSVTPFDLAVRDNALWRLVLTARDDNGVDHLLRATASFQRIISVLFDEAKRGNGEKIEVLIAFARRGSRELRSYFIWLVDRFRDRLRGIPEAIGQIVLGMIAAGDAAQFCEQRRVILERQWTRGTQGEDHGGGDGGGEGGGGVGGGGEGEGGGGGGESRSAEGGGSEA